MTHITGLRKELVTILTEEFTRAIRTSGCTISEAQQALHEADVALLKAALRPLERFNCPTCPTELLTLDKLKAIEAAIADIRI